MHFYTNMCIAIYTACLVVYGAGRDTDTISPSMSLVWGPGLQSDIVLPVRYFFIQVCNSHGNNITQSLGEKAFHVEIVQTGKDQGAWTSVWIQVLDRHDGSYLVRYKLMRSYRDLVINVWYIEKNGDRSHVSRSPYNLRGPVYHEKCYCPESSVEVLLQSMGCPASYEQIDSDLATFKRVNMTSIVKDAFARYNQRYSHSLAHYVVKNNRIYRRTLGEHVGFKMFMDAILLSITRKVHLRDLEFVVNLGDWPLELKRTGRTPLPIFSWCGSDDSYDIVMPTYDITESTLETMGRVSLDLLSVQANTGPSWSNKSSLAFWRGRDSRQERLDLVKLSRSHPQIIDAKLTNMFFFKHDAELGEIVKHISFYDFFDHKYQITLDGTVAAYRLPYLLAGNSVIIKQESPYYEHFYSLLKPYVHFIPMKRDLSDLLTQIQWAKDNNNAAQMIAHSAQTLVHDHLLPRNIFCYHILLFNRFSQYLVFQPPEIGADMEEVTQPKDQDSHCDCDRTQGSAQQRVEL